MANHPHIERLNKRLDAAREEAAAQDELIKALAGQLLKGTDPEVLRAALTELLGDNDQTVASAIGKALANPVSSTNPGRARVAKGREIAKSIFTGDTPTDLKKGVEKARSQTTHNRSKT